MLLIAFEKSKYQFTVSNMWGQWPVHGCIDKKLPEKSKNHLSEFLAFTFVLELHIQTDFLPFTLQKEDSKCEAKCLETFVVLNRIFFSVTVHMHVDK